jgi:hypothetical protein
MSDLINNFYNERQKILDNLRGNIKKDIQEEQTYDDDDDNDDKYKRPQLRREQTYADDNEYERPQLRREQTYADDNKYERPQLRREQKRYYDEEYKPLQKRMPRRMKTPEKKEKKVNVKLQKFNQCLTKLKNENPQLSHKEAQKSMRQIITQLKANQYNDPEDTFLKMNKNN